MSVYDKIVETFHEGIEKPAAANDSASQQVVKGKRPLKMPKNYDFSVRNVNWKAYKNDYLLRTDAIWERSKLFDVFYSHFKKEVVYD